MESFEGVRAGGFLFKERNKRCFNKAGLLDNSCSCYLRGVTELVVWKRTSLDSIDSLPAVTYVSWNFYAALVVLLEL